MKTVAKQKTVSPWLPIILCWCAYTSTYLGRYSYSANIPAVIADRGITYAEAGLVSTCFFFAYGIGQFANGILSKYYHKRYIIPLALFVSALLNLAIFVGVPFSVFKYLWLANGAMLSILWPTLIATIAEKTPNSHYHKASLTMSTTATVGTFLTYGLSALLNWWGGYAYSFLIGAVAMIAVGLVWLLGYRRLFPAGDLQRVKQGAGSVSKQVDKRTILLIVVLCLLAAIVNLVKDGLTTWVPSILTDKFELHRSLSILLTLLLPALGILGAFSNAALYQRTNNRMTNLTVWYGLTVLFIVAVIVFLDTSLWYVVLIALGGTSLFTHAVNIIITSEVPLTMHQEMNSGLLAGILNGCCYVGSTISSYGLGWLADRTGWNGVFYLLLGMCTLAVLITLLGRRISPADRTL